jgi:hypothetical protein
MCSEAVHTKGLLAWYSYMYRPRNLRPPPYKLGLHMKRMSLLQSVYTHRKVQVVALAVNRLALWVTCVWPLLCSDHLSPFGCFYRLNVTTTCQQTFTGQGSILTCRPSVLGNSLRHRRLWRFAARHDLCSGTRSRSDGATWLRMLVEDQ